MPGGKFCRLHGQILPPGSGNTAVPLLYLQINPFKINILEKIPQTRPLARFSLQESQKKARAE